MDSRLKPLSRLIIFWIVILMAAGCESTQEPQKVPSGAEKETVFEGMIVALGDSLTAGLGIDTEMAYPAQLQKKLDDGGYRFKVVNAGVSGETSTGMLSRIDWVLSQKPDIVILEIGANDGLRGLDPSLIENNLRQILKKLDQAGVVTIFAGMKMVWNLGEDYTTAFNIIYSKLADETGVLFMPFFLDGVAAVASLNIADGIHPNGEGYAHITENLYPYVIEAVNELRKRKQQ